MISLNEFLRQLFVLARIVAIEFVSLFFLIVSAKSGGWETLLGIAAFAVFVFFLLLGLWVSYRDSRAEWRRMQEDIAAAKEKYGK